MSGDPVRPLGASAVAQVLAELASARGALPDDAADELRRLLGHSLAGTSATRRRDARLGLLFELVAQAPGEVPTEQAYNEVRAARLAAGEDWPTAQALGQAYGHWLAGDARRDALLVRRRPAASRVRP